MRIATLRCLITASIALLLFSSSAIAQLPLRFGLTFNPLMSWYRIDNKEIKNEGSRIGFQYGLTMDYNIDENERYALSTGLLIIHQGSKFKSASDLGIVATRTDRLQYIELPITAKLKANEFNYMTIFGQIGMTPGVNIRARGDLMVEPDPTGALSFENEKLDNINILNVSLTIGAGVEYALAENTSLVGGIFFNNGFFNVVDDSDGDKVAVNNLALKIGVLF